MKNNTESKILNKNVSRFSAKNVIGTKHRKVPIKRTASAQL